MIAASIAKALGGVPSGSGWLVRCPCPSHGKGRGDVRPSLSIADGSTTLLVNCHSGCDSIHVLTELRKRGLLDDDDQRSRRHDLSTDESNRRRLSTEIEPNPEAQCLWRAAALGSGTLVKTYLGSRGITSVPASLRFVSAEYIRGRVYLPSMLAAVQGPDRSIVAVQYTFLKHDGSGKAPVAIPRRTMGLLGTGAVRLAAAAPIMGLAEGVETGLAAQQLTGIPTWVSLGAQRMPRVWLPDDVLEIHVFADNDKVGLEAAERVVREHPDRRVVVRLPPSGCGDWADAAMIKNEVAA